MEREGSTGGLLFRCSVFLSPPALQKLGVGRALSSVHSGRGGDAAVLHTPAHTDTLTHTQNTQHPLTHKTHNNLTHTTHAHTHTQHPLTHTQHPHTHTTPSHTDTHTTPSHTHTQHPLLPVTRNRY